MSVGKQHNTAYHLFGRPPAFLLIIAYKALWGIAEVILGTLILFSWKIITRELGEDPNDLFLNWLLVHLPFGQKQALPLGAAVLTFGAVKLALAIGLWFHPKLTRQLGIIFLSGAGFVGTYATLRSYSVFKAMALAFDISILLYFIFVLPRHLSQDTTV